MDKKTTDILSYCTFIGWVIAIAMTNDKEASKFHLNQGLVICLASMLMGSFSWVFPMMLPFGMFGYFRVVLGLAQSAFGIFVVVSAIMGIIAAANGEEKPVFFWNKIEIIK